MVSATIIALSEGCWRVAEARLEEYLERDSRENSHEYWLIETDIFSTSNHGSTELLRKFGVPNHIFADCLRRSNGFFNFQDSYDVNGNLNSHNAWFRFLVKTHVKEKSICTPYLWNEMTFFSNWTPLGCKVICIGIPNHFSSILQSALSNMWSKETGLDPYSLHVPLIESIISLHDSAVWSIRDIVRDVEIRRCLPSAQDWDFVQLHEGLRHAIHSFETLKVSVDTLEAITKQQLDIMKRGTDQAAATAVNRHMEAQTRLLRNFLWRSESTKQRLSSEISLGYNLIAQRDSQSMKCLQEQATIETNAMRSIAVVSMAFLPPTFLSAIFSTTFFYYAPKNGDQAEAWGVSGKFWVYWAIALPLTVLTMLTWFRFQKKKKALPYDGAQC